MAAGRNPTEVRLLPVTKAVGPRIAEELARLGETDLAENRVDELERKRSHFEALDSTTFSAAGVRWHLIGHLQRNKAQRAVRAAAVIHSIDSIELLERVNRCDIGDSRVRVYLEVKLVEGAQRHGFAPAQLTDAVRAATNLERIQLVGLMTMAAQDPQSRPGELATQQRARATFAHLAQLARALPREAFADGRVELSMGMSSDLEAAIHEGAHVVRVGSALFAGVDSGAGADGARA